MLHPLFAKFLSRHKLPASYLHQATQHFSPIIDDILHQLTDRRPILLGINGSQGSGKTTLAAYLQTALAAEHQLRVVSISIDDFYYGKAERQQLAEQVHPLLATRGVPGTHDVPLALATLNALRQAEKETVAIPRFDKASDDRLAEPSWDRVQTPVDVVILEGWCLGAAPEAEAALKEPVNPLEAVQDSDGRWRHYINQQLASVYPPLFKQIDIWVMLQAPSFDCVYQWRLEQEQKLAEKLQSIPQKNQNGWPAAAPAGLMDASQIQQFVQYFQRLTQHMLNTLPAQVDHVYRLDNKRKIIDEIHRSYATSG